MVDLVTAMLATEGMSHKRYLPHGVFFVAGQGIAIVLRIEVGLLGHYLAWSRLTVQKEVYPCGAILGMRHKIAISFHFLPKRVIHGYSIDPHNRAGVVLVAVKGHFLKIAVQVIDARQGKGIVDEVNDEGSCEAY